MRLFTLVFLLVLSLPAFAQNWGGGEGDERLSRLEDEVQRLSTQRGGAGNGAALAGPAAQQLDARLTQLEQQVQQLTGNVERAQYNNAQLLARLDRLSQDIEVRFADIQKQMQIQQQQAALTPPPAVVPAASEAAPAPESSGTHSDAQSIYDDGFSKLRQADYAGAEKAFKQFLGGYPSHQLAGNADYWLGETFYVRGQFKEAAVTFADGYQKYPKNSKAPDNLLKLGMSLSSLGSKDDACLTLSELKSKYPSAAPTIKARADQERKKLGCK